MKKMFLIALLAVFTLSCGPSRDELARVADARVTDIVIDSCSYLIVTSSRGVSVTHKENCKNHKNLTK